MCADGTLSCPKTECLMGTCSTSWPGCGEVDPCENLECGDVCAPCNGMDCPVSDIAFRCNAKGKCAPEQPQCGECMSAMDCPADDQCMMCAGGVCAPTQCVEGTCMKVCPTVDPPVCMSEADCPHDDICRYCPDMSCAEVACISGECKSVCPL
jgi:hypothetical protein